MERLQTLERIHVIKDPDDPKQRFFSAEQIRRQYEHAGEIIVCDFPVQPSDSNIKDIRDSNGNLLGEYHVNYGIANFDHHLDRPDFSRLVSATNLINRLKEDKTPQNDVFRAAEFVVTSHVDYDAATSSGVVAKYLPVDENVLGAAAIVADHTGAKVNFNDRVNTLALVGNALTNLEDIPLSLQTIDAIYRGKSIEEVKEIDPRIELELNVTLRQIENLERWVKKRLFHSYGNGVYYGKIPTPVFGQYLLQYFPKAWVIITSMQTIDEPFEYAMQIRAGLQWPEGNSLRELDIPNFKGRWNAGSIKGTHSVKDPIEVLDHVVRGVGKLRRKK
jgi:hypothetical protein